jgi:hypothetical protein
MKHTTKLTWQINLLSLFKIPLLAFTFPRILELNEKNSVVKVKLGWKTQNHLNVMYFGALAMGAELSVALQAIDSINKSGRRVDFIFKDFKCEFLKRTDGDAHFVCEETVAVKNLVQAAIDKPDRVEQTFKGYTRLEKDPSQIVMTYALTLSMKAR